MTQAFNLSQLANNLNTSGQLDATDGLTGVVPTGNLPTIPVSKGGTNLTATPSNGQIPIGNGSGYSLATITAGSGITVTNGSGSITIASGGGGVTSLNGQTGAITNTSYLAIGSYALGILQVFNPVAGTTYSSSDMRIVNVGVTNTCSPQPFCKNGERTGFSGTWRAMNDAQVNYGLCLFVRVS